MTSLEQVRALLADPASWTRHQYARDATGRTARPTDAGATCFCLEGAFMQVGGHGFTIAADDPGRLMLRRVLGQSLPMFNDDPDTTHADVLRALDKAIELEKIHA